MNKTENEQNVCDAEETIKALQAENERLRRENKKFYEQMESVANANARAAERLAILEGTAAIDADREAVAEIKVEITQLQRENEKLQRQARGVAAANAYAAELMVQLEDTNKTLKDEIANRQKIEQKLRLAYTQIEARVEERTAELKAINEQLKKEISERKRTEQALLESENRLKTIFENVQTGIIIIDPETHKIVDANPVAAKLVGSDRTQMTGAICHKYVCPAEVGKCPITDLKQKIDNAERELLTASGEKRPIMKTVTTVMLDGKPHLVESFIDISELRKAEQELEKLNNDLEWTVCELKQTNNELKNFVHVAAHDLKTPLRGIGTLAQWLISDYVKKFDNQGQQNLNLLIERAKQADGILDTLLNYSKIERVKQIEGLIDIKELLADIIDRIKIPSNFKLTIENKLPVVTGNLEHLKQVFYNLLANAVQYMDKPYGQIKIGCVRDCSMWKFSISDNGPGIEQKHFDRIFRIFQTLDADKRPKTAGIGLPLTRKIIELYGGKIWVESQPGQGSTFFFTFPVHETTRKN